MSCIEQLRRIRETASGSCAEILDRAIEALEDEQDDSGTPGPGEPARPRQVHAQPQEEHNWIE